VTSRDKDVSAAAAFRFFVHAVVFRFMHPSLMSIDSKMPRALSAVSDEHASAPKRKGEVMRGLSVSSSGIVYPDDMKLLKQVYDRICRENHVEEGSKDAEKIAQAAISIFQAGVFDEDELRAGLGEFIKRRS